MKTSMRLSTVLAIVVGWLMVIAAPAGAGVILPVGANFAPVAGSPVTLSIFQGTANAVDVTDTWRPTWNPVTGNVSASGTSPLTVYVVVNVNGVPTAPSSISLVSPVGVTAASFTGSVNPFLNPAANTLTTSAYPGQCTNYGSSSDFSPDFTFNATAASIATATGSTLAAFALTPLDCGGMAVLSVAANGGVFRFIVPQDSNLNGIPDNWENVFCPSNTCPTGKEDADAGPVTGSTVPVGDGIAAFDEYRGFIVSGAHVSTDPRQKDVFVHVVNPQCTSTLDPGSLLGGGGTLAFPTVAGTSLFDGVDTLVSGTQIHLLDYQPFAQNLTLPSPEWVDNFVSYSDATGIVYTSAGSTKDRQINANALYPIRDAVTGLTVQKGLRVIECLDETVTSPLGVSGVGSPNGPDNAIIYTKRIVNYINSMVDAALPRAVQLLTYQYVNGSLTAVSTYKGVAAPGAYPIDPDRNRIISAAILYYVAMELAHSTQLTPTIEGTKTTSYGYHHAPGTGSNLDQAILNKVDNKTTGFNSFYIPSIYISNDQGSFKLHN